MWWYKTYTKKKVKAAAFINLKEENAKKEKTNNIFFDKLEIIEYLLQNENTPFSKLIFSIRSKTTQIHIYKQHKETNWNCKICDKEI